jgi:nitric oxide reductase large subunit
MGLADLASATVGRIVGRLARRVVGWALVGLFGLAALYQASVAATVALETLFGAFYAHLMIAGFYALAAIAIVIFLMVAVRRPFVDDDYRKTLAQLPVEAQVATIIEALLLGYAISRRK